MIDTQAIRKKILDLALRGKLTEQLPEDGTAEELYQQVLEAKAHFELASNERKSKPLPDITDEELPFIIPISWKWVHLGEIFAHNTGKALNISDTTGRLLEYITTSNVYWDRFELTSLKTMYFKDDEIDKCTIKKGDLLVCEGGDIGRSAIWVFDREMRIQNHIHRLRRYNDSICTKFYYYVMQHYKMNNLIRGQGIGLEGFSSKRLHSLVIPYPPIAEQLRIVGIVDLAFETLKQIDTLQSQYQDNLAALKSKIIDAGIQGKLTEQLPEDCTAEELYQQIQQEKTALEKAGKIKKSKPLPPIDEEEKPFDIPENWKWVRLDDVVKTIDAGKSIKCNEVVPTNDQPGIIRVSAVTWGTFNENESKTCLSENDWHSEYQILRNDFLVSRANTVKLIAACVIVEKIDKRLMLSDKILRLSFASNIDLHYMLFALRSNTARAQIESKATGTSDSMRNISQGDLRSIIIPLPPLAEQKRIVAKLEGLLAVCEG